MAEPHKNCEKEVQHIQESLWYIQLVTLKQSGSTLYIRQVKSYHYELVCLVNLVLRTPALSAQRHFRLRAQSAT